MKTIKDKLKQELKKFAQGNITNEYHPDETIDNIVVHLEAICREVIGETEIAYKKPKATTRNELKLEQLARLKQLIGE